MWFFSGIGYDRRVKNDMIPTSCWNLPVLLAVLFSSLAVGQESPPQAEWFTAHSGSQEESHAHYVMTCEDGGYLQIGETGYVGASAKMFVVKTDAAGNLDWKREFGSGNRNMGNSAVEVEDGYLVCGMLSRNSAILKLNKSTGSTLFQKTHDLGGTDAFEHLALTDDGILAVGYRNAEDPNNLHGLHQGRFQGYRKNRRNETNEQCRSSSKDARSQRQPTSHLRLQLRPTLDPYLC